MKTLSLSRPYCEIVVNTRLFFFFFCLLRHTDRPGNEEGLLESGREKLPPLREDGVQKYVRGSSTCISFTDGPSFDLLHGGAGCTRPQLGVVRLAIVRHYVPFFPTGIIFIFRFSPQDGWVYF